MIKKIIIAMVLVFVVVAMAVWSSGNESITNENITKENTEIVSISIELNEKGSTEEDMEEILNGNIEEQYNYDQDPYIKEFKKFIEETSGRFNYHVYEEFIERKKPLNEEDFKKLKKGQYINQEVATLENSKYLGVIETIGMYDGEIVYTMPNRNGLPLSTDVYYKIGENTYVVLLFKDRFSIANPLEKVEVWEEIWKEDGTYEVKKRELEID